jgi:hypothetical protein
LATAFQLAGRLADARAYAESCLTAGDHSWMLHYGIDPLRYKRDIHEILSKTYFGLAKTEKFMMYAGLWEKAKSFGRTAFYWFKGYTHRLLFKKYGLASANGYGAAGNNDNLDALDLYYKVFDSYPNRAVAYTRKAFNVEFPIIPDSFASYRYKEGSVLKDRAALEEAADNFNPVWERDMLAEAYAELARMGKKGKKGEKSDYAAVEKLFALNRGALRQNGLALPASIIINADGKYEKNLKKAVYKAGIRSGTAENRFELTLTADKGEVRCKLYDKGKGVDAVNRVFSLLSLSAEDVSAFSRAFGNAVFTE